MAEGLTLQEHLKRARDERQRKVSPERRREIAIAANKASQKAKRLKKKKTI